MFYSKSLLILLFIAATVYTTNIYSPTAHLYTKQLCCVHKYTQIIIFLHIAAMECRTWYNAANVSPHDNCAHLSVTQHT